MIDLNPLDALKQRKMKFLPVHFVKTKLSEIHMFDDEVEQWVRSKLKGRYFISKVPSLDQNGKLKSIPILGLEDQKEMTYFMLACPHIRR
jgi:hypothetical protein